MGQQTMAADQASPNPSPGVYPGHPPPAGGAAGMYPTGQDQYMHPPMHHPMGVAQPVAYGPPHGGPYMGGSGRVAYAGQHLVMPAPVAVVAVQNPEFMSSSAKSLIIIGLVLTAIGFILCIVGEATRKRPNQGHTSLEGSDTAMFMAWAYLFLFALATPVMAGASKGCCCCTFRTGNGYNGRLTFQILSWIAYTAALIWSIAIAICESSATCYVTSGQNIVVAIVALLAASFMTCSWLVSRDIPTYGGLPSTANPLPRGPNTFSSESDDPGGVPGAPQPYTHPQ